MSSMYPLTVRWTDGTTTVLKSEADHMRRVGRCRHEEGVFQAMSALPTRGRWKCLSVALWRAG